FEHGLSGYLHWAMDNWQYAIDDQDVKGDGYIIEPDKEHNTFKPTIRYESLRDGLEDRELLQIVAQKDPGLADGIAHSLVTGATRYSRDTAFMRRIRDLLVTAAAGKADFDAQLARASTSRIDLGQQSQVDAVKVTWKSAGTRTFAVQTSYDGVRWGTAATVDRATGPDAFVGVDAKARYIRVQVSAGPKGVSTVRVAGVALDAPNLAGGKKYTKSVRPDHPDARNATSTDGILAGDSSDGRSWGVDVAPGTTATVSATVDLGSTQPVGRIDIHRYQDYETRYSPDSVHIATSVDGKTFVDKGQLEQADGPDGLWYDFTFPATDARYIKVTYTKTGADQADALFIDEVEAYAPPAAQGVNFAQGLSYQKSAAPDDPTYPDSGDAESTDGVIAGPSSDGHGYAYYLDSGQTRTISITIDLQGPKTISSAQLAKYDDAVHSYAPDRVAIYTRKDGEDFVERGSTTWGTGQWFTVDFAPVSASYVRFDITKTQGHFADYLFLDELAVYGDPATSTTNVALHRPYTKSDGGDPNYPDTGGADSTDGVIAGAYPDHLSYAYLLSDGETRTVDITVDLGRPRDLELVRFWRYNDGQHNYAPDKIVVSTSTDGQEFIPQSTVTEPDERWFIAPLKDVPARYVRISATKTYAYFGEYIFVDEIQAFGR
ncbi:MAG TPA: discoidin domain-containing protein, partial [Mycobacteriales bacterium]|nr:discoidin domain-containing protein [Mycobacteriales bacterium]